MKVRVRGTGLLAMLMIGAKSCVQRIVVKAEGARWPSGFAPWRKGARWMARCSRHLKRRRLPSSTPGGRARLRNVLFVLFIGLAPACAPAPDSTPTARTVGLLLNEPEAFVGYTLFNRVRSKTIYLIDNQGRVVIRGSWRLTPCSQSCLRTEICLLTPIEARTSMSRASDVTEVDPNGNVGSGVPPRRPAS